MSTDCHVLWLHTAGVVIKVCAEVGLEQRCAELKQLWSHCLVNQESNAPAHLVLNLRHTRAVAEHMPASPADPLPDPPTDLPADQAVLYLDAHDPDASYEFSGALTREILRLLVGSKILLHAGAVDLPEAGTVLATGASGAGKSTAIAELSRTGTYLTDELTIIEPESFSLTPYPKPLSRVYEKTPRTRKRDFPLPQCGVASVRTHLSPPPQHLVLIQRDSDAQGMSLTPMTMLESLCTLASQSSSIWRFTRPLSLLAQFVASLDGAWQAHYAEVSGLADALAAAQRKGDHRAVQNQPYELWIPEDAHPTSFDMTTAPETLGDRPAFANPRYSLGPFYEAISQGDEIAVLTKTRVPKIVYLPGLTGLVWEIIFREGEMRFEEVTRRAVAIAGEHPEADQLVREALDRAVGEGVLAEA